MKRIITLVFLLLLSKYNYVQDIIWHGFSSYSLYNDSVDEVKLLLDSTNANEIKDSLVAAGWTYRENFPYFKKSIKTGRAPKSCTFSADGKNIFVTLLNDKEKGVEIFEIDPLKKIKDILPPCEYQKYNFGYPEGIFNKKDNSFWFTRMTTGEFFIYKSGSLKSHNAKGTWTKTVAFNPNNEIAALAHWVSNSISLFETETLKHIKTIKTGNTPRGIVWIDDSTIAVALFGDGDIQIFDVNRVKLIHTITGVGAMRDILYDEQEKILYFSNLARRKVYKYSWKDKKILAIEEVDSHPNTIRLTPDRKYLFVSCRGPNNKNGYTLRSPRNGKLFLIRTSDFKILKNWHGGNQPTGLDVSPDGRFLASTDFQDARLNIYLISRQ